jgi:hypothetical protein
MTFSDSKDAYTPMHTQFEEKEQTIMDKLNIRNAPAISASEEGALHPKIRPQSTVPTVLAIFRWCFQYKETNRNMERMKQTSKIRLK